MKLDRDIFTVLLMAAVCVVILLIFGVVKRTTAPILNTTPDYANRGRELARQCLPCHDLTPARTLSEKGPPLWGIVDAMAGHTLYPYSEGYMELAKRCLVWNEANLDRFLTDPKRFMPGTRKDYAPIADPEQRRLLIEFLTSLQDPQVTQPTLVAAENYAQVSATLNRMRGENAKRWRKAGAKEAQKCTACHDLTQSAEIIVGPPLVDIVEREVGSSKGFCYSPGFRRWMENKENPKVWDEVSLYRFLYAPQSHIPHTRMLFRGVRDDYKRAALIGHLKRLP
ncbi:cytochrome c, class I [Magnetococcus marinus MC-1]|uniref:Cytochrome c, class I n=1 Tax=Magnetococcus marinus (strain ATCC BAA-1437 / JCM 17883 / MC-1) TaxID=156889 RepID=A0LDB7_MAGMM|nr:cytochrome C, class I [Magnetococcus marinus]ABK45960.1 cytochrome c, class I [Magnetococcus marinus MC-1]